MTSKEFFHAVNDLYGKGLSNRVRTQREFSLLIAYRLGEDFDKIRKAMLLGIHDELFLQTQVVLHDDIGEPEHTSRMNEIADVAYRAIADVLTPEEYNKFIGTVTHD
jgi:hypothetical protein